MDGYPPERPRYKKITNEEIDGDNNWSDMTLGGIIVPIYTRFGKFDLELCSWPTDETFHTLSELMCSNMCFL